MTSSTSLMTGFAITFVLMSLGCQTFHSDLTEAEVTERLRERFELGMTSEQVTQELRWIRVDEIRVFSSEREYPFGPVSEGDLGAVIWPKRFLIFGGIVDYYFRDMILFRFGSDGLLDDAVYRPFEWNQNRGGPYLISLANEKEVEP